MSQLRCAVQNSFAIGIGFAWCIGLQTCSFFELHGLLSGTRSQVDMANVQAALQSTAQAVVHPEKAHLRCCFLGASALCAKMKNAGDLLLTLLITNNIN